VFEFDVLSVLAVTPVSIELLCEFMLKKVEKMPKLKKASIKIGINKTNFISFPKTDIVIPLALQFYIFAFPVILNFS